MSAGEAEARELQGLSAQVLVAHICGSLGIMNPNLQSSKPELFPLILPDVMSETRESVGEEGGKDVCPWWA